MLVSAICRPTKLAWENIDRAGRVVVDRQVAGPSGSTAGTEKSDPIGLWARNAMAGKGCQSDRRRARTVARL